jgi:hypothetical protein
MPAAIVIIILLVHQAIAAAIKAAQNRSLYMEKLEVPWSKKILGETKAAITEAGTNRKVLIISGRISPLPKTQNNE